MRAKTFVAVPILVALGAAPAAAQISADIHIGPFGIGGRDRVVVVPDDRYDYGPEVVVVGYPGGYGDWRYTAAYWRPVTLYLFGGHYYERPFRNARPVVVYRYRDRFFFAPRDRDWDRYRSRYERNEWRVYRDDRGGWRDDWRNDRRDVRQDNRTDRRDVRQDNRIDRRDVRQDNRIDRRDTRQDNRVDRRDDRRDNRPATVSRGNGNGRGAARAPGQQGRSRRPNN